MPKKLDRRTSVPFCSSGTQKGKICHLKCLTLTQIVTMLCSLLCICPGPYALKACDISWPAHCEGECIYPGPCTLKACDISWPACCEGEWIYPGPYALKVGFTTGIPWVQISNTIPLPVNTVTIAGEGMTPYMFGYGVISKKIKLLRCPSWHQSQDHHRQ